MSRNLPLLKRPIGDRALGYVPSGHEFSSFLNQTVHFEEIGMVLCRIEDQRTLNPAHLLNALAFAADKHRRQRRKDAEASPYINHPIAVATVLAVEGDVSDEATLLCAFLHDTVEDTHTTYLELEQHFGAEVAELVRELTDDESLEKAERKRLQIEYAKGLSWRAKQVRIADKICNIRDIMVIPPAHWPVQRRLDYLVWSEKVVAHCRGVNPKLDGAFDEAVRQAQDKLTVAS